MIIIPAIDVKDGRCVRLSQGRMDSATVYAEDPVEAALKWESMGAALIHLVDLDGAVGGAAMNFNVIKKIALSVSVPVQIGGGIRDITTAQKYLALKNVKRIILGTAAYEDHEFVTFLSKKYPGRIAVGIDAKGGLVAINGWVTITREKAIDLARRLEGEGVSCIIYTDIARDGMLAGPNVEATREMTDAVNIPVVASGGITTLDDIASYRGAKIEGIIIGKALYAGNLDLKEAMRIASEHGGA